MPAPRVTAVLSASLVAVGLAAGAPGAGAVSTSIGYACNPGADAFTLPVVLDTDAPTRMVVGRSTQLVVSAAATLPGSRAQAAWNAGARTLSGTWTLQGGFGSSTALDQTIPSVPLPDESGAPADAPFSAASAPVTFTAPSTPGVVELTAGDLAGALQLAPSGGPLALTCTAPKVTGKAPVIDTITVVASSTTTLTLDRSTSEYGQDVTAMARVTTSSGTPDGDVAFSVDGVATKARVGKDGVATLVLPDARSGAHGVTATFVPRDTTTYDGSASAAQAWTVTPARTRIRIPVTGLTTKVVTRVGVRAKGVFGSVPTGKVRIKVVRVGRAGTRVRVRTLDATGAAKAGYGRLAKGRYRATVVYRGDADHLALTKSRTFRVTRG